jgi:hypothetical protein
MMPITKAISLLLGVVDVVLAFITSSRYSLSMGEEHERAYGASLHTGTGPGL